MLENTIESLRAAATTHAHDETDYARGIAWGIRFAADIVERDVADFAIIGPFSVGEEVVVHLLDGKHEATITQLGPVFCYVTTATAGVAMVTLSELVEWNR